MKRNDKGMTLIELMIVIVIVGVLASIAIPSYRAYVIRAQRSDARAALLALAAAQEKYYLQCNSYVETLDPTTASTCPGATGTLRFSPTSEQGYYTVTVTADDPDNPQAWIAAATPASGSPQEKDNPCQYISLSSTGARRGGASKTAAEASTEPGTCWQK